MNHQTSTCPPCSGECHRGEECPVEEPLSSGEACSVIAGICVALLAFMGIAWTAVRFWQ